MQKRKQKFLSFLLVLALIICSVPAFSLSAVADGETSGKCGDNLIWEYNSSTYNLTISGTGDMYNYNYNSSPWYSYRANIKTVNIGNSVTSIGSYAFNFCTGLTSIEIPNSVTSIGSYAFSHCSGLTNIEIPSSVTCIGDEAFRDCSGLTSVTIGNSVTSIGSRAFYGCSNLIYNQYDNAYYLGNENNPYLVLVKSISTSISSCIINNNTKVICWSAFEGCSGLTSIEIPKNVTSIGKAITAMSGVETITVVDGNTKYYSEGNCIIEKDEKVLISGCKNSVIPYGVKSIGACAFAYGGPKDIKIPDSVTSIGACAFTLCTELTSIEIPNSVISIGGSAFGGCMRVKSIILGNSVTSIENYAFEGCIGLTSVTIGNSVTSIGDCAFSGSDSLKNVYYSGTAEQRNNISIGNYNSYLTNATWHYNCTPEHAKVLIKIDEKGSTLKANYLKTAIQKQKNAKPSDSEYNLRLISMLNCLEDYKEVGFYITIAGYNDGENDEPIKYSTDTVYTSFLNGNTRVKASDYGAEYFTIVNMTVPNEYYYSNMKIKPYIMFTDGTEFLGNEITTTVSKYIK